MQNPETTPRDSQRSTETDPDRPVVYEAPRITAKLPLDKVTLFTGSGSGGGGGHIGGA